MLLLLLLFHLSSRIGQSVAAGALENAKTSLRHTVARVMDFWPGVVFCIFAVPRIR